MKIFDRILKNTNLPPDASVLRERIAWMMNLMISVRGYDYPLDPDTAIVLEPNYEVSLTHVAGRIDAAANVLGLVYLKELAFYEDFKTMQLDQTARRGALGLMSINYLADQAARRLLNVADNPDSPSAAMM